ncbi:hypothetical protein Bca101_056022 [Brassica carinata]
MESSLTLISNYATEWRWSSSLLFVLQYQNSNLTCLDAAASLFPPLRLQLLRAVSPPLMCTAEPVTMASQPRRNKNNNGYYGGYYPQVYQYYPIYGYDMMNYASGKTTNTTPQYSYLGRSDSRMYSMYGPYMTGYGHYNTYTPNWSENRTKSG